MLSKNKMIIISFMLCFIIGIIYFSQNKKEITVVDNGEKKVFQTSLHYVQELLDEYSIEYNERDRIYPSLIEKLNDGMEIIIERPHEVDIFVDNKNMKAWTFNRITGDVLRENGIMLGDNDRTVPQANQPCEDSINVIRVRKEVIFEEQPIAYKLETIKDETLYQGEQRIIQKGKTGLERFTYEAIFENDSEVDRTLIERLIIREPIKQIMALGSLKTVSRSGDTLKFKEMFEMKATGYTHTGNMTHTDTWPAHGTVAVDPKIIPLGTRLYIDGYGYATALDIGGAIKNNRIDLFFDTREEALIWGVRPVKVFVLE